MKDFGIKLLEVIDNGFKTAMDHPVAAIMCVYFGSKLLKKNKPETCSCNCKPVSEQPVIEEA